MPRWPGNGLGVWPASQVFELTRQLSNALPQLLVRLPEQAHGLRLALADGIGGFARRCLRGLELGAQLVRLRLHALGVLSPRRPQRSVRRLGLLARCLTVRKLAHRLSRLCLGPARFFPGLRQAHAQGLQFTLWAATRGEGRGGGGAASRPERRELSGGRRGPAGLVLEPGRSVSALSAPNRSRSAPPNARAGARARKPGQAHLRSWVGRAGCCGPLLGKVPAEAADRALHALGRRLVLESQWQRVVNSVELYRVGQDEVSLAGVGTSGRGRRRACARSRGRGRLSAAQGFLRTLIRASGLLRVEGGGSVLAPLSTAGRRFRSSPSPRK